MFRDRIPSLHSFFAEKHWHREIHVITKLLKMSVCGWTVLFLSENLKPLLSSVFQWLTLYLEPKSKIRGTPDIKEYKVC